MRPLKRDPAPSRFAYRMNRLLLTPFFWRALRVGLPVAAILGLLLVWIGDADRRQAIVDLVAETRRQIEERPEFAVHALEVSGASAPVAAAVREVAQLRLPMTTFDLDLGAIRARVAALDAVKRAELRVRRGGILAIEIEERQPALVHRLEGRTRLIDAEGHLVAALGKRDERPDLPLIVGQGAAAQAAEALALVAAAAPVADAVRGLVRVGERRWDLVLTRGRRILLPEGDPVAALEHVIALDSAQDLLARDVSVVDMRLPHRTTLRLVADPFSDREDASNL